MRRGGCCKRRSEKGLRIDSASVGMESARSYQASGASVRRFVITEYQGSLSSNMAFGNALNGTTVGGGQEEKKEEEGEQVQEKQNGVPTMEEWQNRFGIRNRKIGGLRESSSVAENLRQVTLRYIFDMLFAARRGRMKEWLREQGYQNGQPDSQESAQVGPSDNAGNTAGTMFGAGRESGAIGTAGPESNNFYMLQARRVQGNMRTLSYRQESWYAEQENTTFSTTGTVKTTDGREIHFNVDLEMSRSFEEYFSEDVAMTNFSLCDPLVINMDVGSAELSDQKFYFDLDADGEEDEIAMLGSGSGYLALDKNGDGKINDGRELFGTSSGDGFKDLAEYDTDHNGWIDENDAVWSKLKIWTKDENGQDKLYTLGEKGVGAIYLGSASTDFTLANDTGSTKGLIRRTGIFLYENGAAGTVQHLDVAKYRKEA